MNVTGQTMGSDPDPAPDQVLETLKQGNLRFAKDQRRYPHQSILRRNELANNQQPFATVITCSDSRVSPELVFDQGLGDLFVIRVGGNVIGQNEAGSIEFGVKVLQTPLFVVMGHTTCAAVMTAVEGAEVSESISLLLKPIVPAVDHVREQYPKLTGRDLVEAAVKQNIWQGIEDLFQRSADTCELVMNGKLKVVGAYYHHDSGEVEWLGEHPQQDEILKKESKPGDRFSFVHVVYFWLKADVTKEAVQQLIDDCNTYLGSIETVRELEVGTPAGTPRDVADNSFAVNLIVHFDDKAGHDYYQSAQKHLDFIKRNKHTWERVQVYDMVK